MNDLTQKIKKSGKLNFSLCLYDEPGSGKSLYARYLANVLGIEVVFKRASDLISKWVGETEQNIEDLVFDTTVFNNDTLLNKLDRPISLADAFRIIDEIIYDTLKEKFLWN